MTCGIYQILNTRDGQFYVGFARNIERRWQQHTIGLGQLAAFEHASYPLRAAFCNCGLSTVVSKQGRTCGFEFFVIETCLEHELLARSQIWIATLQPTYNVVLPSQNLTSRPQTESKIWVYYHNYDKLNHLPNEQVLDRLPAEEWDIYLNCPPLVVTKQRVAPGDSVYQIVGVGKKPKHYYLWSYLIVEDVNVTDDPESPIAIILGEGWLLNAPQHLNTSTFDTFRKRCGNFSQPLVAITHLPFAQELHHWAIAHQPTRSHQSAWTYFESAYQQILSMNPANADLYLRLGLLYYKMGQDRAAIQAFESAISVRPNLPEAHYYHGLACDQLGDVASAAQSLQTAVRCFAEQPDHHELSAIAQAMLQDFQPIQPS
jgi:tetratricopeptide (TPR) repeat protein